MNTLITQCVELVNQCSLPYCIGGGYALELFINKPIRPHSDLDICIYEDNKNEFIHFMINRGWLVYEPQNNGLSRLISDPYNQRVEQICVFCIKPDCSFIKMHPQENDLYQMEITYPEQLNFDFIEVIFNPKDNANFIYSQNPRITRALEKAVLINNDGIPYMSPELILFCKSIYISREGYQKDFDMTVPYLPTESKTWLIEALELSYPEGHEWLSLLKENTP